MNFIVVLVACVAWFCTMVGLLTIELIDFLFEGNKFYQTKNIKKTYNNVTKIMNFSL